MQCRTVSSILRVSYRIHSTESAPNLYKTLVHLYRNIHYPGRYDSSIYPKMEVLYLERKWCPMSMTKCNIFVSQLKWEDIQIRRMFVPTLEHW